MTEAQFEYSVSDDRVGLLTFTRPPVNALRYRDVETLGDYVEDIPVADELAVVLATGGDEMFSAGHDVTQFVDETAPDEETRTELYLRTLRLVYECPLPTITAIDGPAVGAGAILASLCDDRILGPEAMFAITEINVGIIGGLGPLRRVLPDAVARRMAYTGEPLPAERAYELGMASAVVETPLADARALAARIATNNPAAVRAAKASAIAGQPDWPLASYRREREFIDELRGSDDTTEAATAFLEDRDPAFEE